MAQLRQDYPELQRRGVAVVVVGPDDAARFRSFWEDGSLPFTGLPDPDHRVLKLYGQETSIFKLGRMPAQALIDRDGMIRYVHYGKSMQDIPSLADLTPYLPAPGDVPAR